MMTTRAAFLPPKPCRARLGALVALAIAVPPAGAAELEQDQSFALLVASHEGGEGQRPLQFSGADALRVEQVLRELGGLPAEHVERLLDPSAKELRAALARLSTRLKEAESKGQRRQVYFYYSGHARARALSLGAEEFPLDELRAGLEALPATMRFVLLDACQSGAFTRAKGSTPAEDFSFNSARAISSEGLAIIASSASSELSQESGALGSSYFTHHLVSALRGAADTDSDGRVSLDEAYRYTYRATVASTMATRVGAQHPTMESDLRGRGEAILTEVQGRGATLDLRRDLQGRVLISALPSKSVWAEVDKAAGQAVEIALPAGNYSAVLTTDERAWSCPITLVDGAPVALDPAHCTKLDVELTRSKLGTEAPPPEAPPPDRLATRLSFEAFTGAVFHGQDGFVGRLETFDYHDAARIIELSPRFGGSVGLRLSPVVELFLSGETLDARTYQKDIPGTASQAGFTRSFDWSVLGFAGGARVYYPTDTGILQPYVRGSLGLGLASSTLDGVGATSAGPYLKAGIGLAIMPAAMIGGTIEAGVAYAEPLANALDEHRVSGGFYLQFGARMAFLGGE